MAGDKFFVIRRIRRAADGHHGGDRIFSVSGKVREAPPGPPGHRL
jgi:hypothetical protein